MSSYKSSTGWIFTFALASAPIMSSSSYPIQQSELIISTWQLYKVPRSVFTYQILRITKGDLTVFRLIDSSPKSLPTQAAVGDVDT